MVVVTDSDITCIAPWGNYCHEVIVSIINIQGTTLRFSTEFPPVQKFVEFIECNGFIWNVRGIK